MSRRGCSLTSIWMRRATAQRSLSHDVSLTSMSSGRALCASWTYARSPPKRLSGIGSPACSGLSPMRHSKRSDDAAGGSSSTAPTIMSRGSPPQSVDPQGHHSSQRLPNRTGGEPPTPSGRPTAGPPTLRDPSPPSPDRRTSAGSQGPTSRASSSTRSAPSALCVRVERVLHSGNAFDFGKRVAHGGRCVRRQRRRGVSRRSSRAHKRKMRSPFSWKLGRR